MSSEICRKAKIIEKLEINVFSKNKKSILKSYES